jgi:hypothetical protein
MVDSSSLPPVNIFISYADRDRARFQRLSSHLRPLLRNGWLTVWDRQQILPGTNSQQEVQKHLDAADIVLLLISANFFASHEYDHDVSRALIRKEQGQVEIIPVLISSFLWEDSEIGGLSPLPSELPVDRWTNENQAWTSVVEGLKLVIKKVQDAKSGVSSVPPVPQKIDPPPVPAPKIRQKKGEKTYRSVFISYSSKDKVFAEKLHHDLQNQGVHCWSAQKDLKIGDKIRYRVEDAISDHDTLLVVISESAVTDLWVESEIHAVLEKEQAGDGWLLLPIVLDENAKQHPATLPPWARDILRQRHVGDFTRWQNESEYQRMLSALLDALKVT